jgi:hypothetical protein
MLLLQSFDAVLLEDVCVLVELVTLVVAVDAVREVKETCETRRADAHTLDDAEGASTDAQKAVGPAVADHAAAQLKIHLFLRIKKYDLGMPFCVLETIGTEVYYPRHRELRMEISNISYKHHLSTPSVMKPLSNFAASG